MSDLPIDDVTEALGEIAAEDGFYNAEKKPRFVDLDSDVKVKSGINVGEDVDNRDEVLRAATMFMKHPARALSARELAILMYNYDRHDNFSNEKSQGFIDALVEAGFLHEVNEPDDGYTRYRVA